MNANNTVFVSLPHPNPVPTPKVGLQQWKAAANGVAKDIVGGNESERKGKQPTGFLPYSLTDSRPKAPKMPSEQHQNNRFLTGIKATLKISGKWLTAPSVFSRFYDKYDRTNVSDIKIGLDILAKANEIESKVVDSEKQYFLPTSDFERLLNRCQVSRYHLTEITGIDEGVMSEYCKGAKINTADAQMIADELNIELSELEGMVIEPKTPSIEELFEAALPYHIQGSRWGRYIAPGKASRVFDNTTFVYCDPCSNFWDLYNLSKGIFRDVGILLAKSGGTWIAHIPIRILSDTVFVESGLAAVERTLLAHTGIDPAQILREIRKRQFQETQDAIRRGGAK